MSVCSPSVVPIHKGDKFSLNQCPKTELEPKEMENIPYASIVGSLIYSQVCIPDISFALEMLDCYKSNPNIEH